MRRSQLFAGAASMLMAMGLFAGAPSSVADTRQERVVSHDAFEVVKTGKDANGRVYRVVELFTPSESSGFSVGEGSFSTSERGVERAELRTLPAPTGKPILNLTITSFADEVRVESPRETLRTSKASGALVADGGRTLVLRGLQPGESTQIEFDSTGSQGEQITRSLPLRTLEANTAAAALATAFQYANAVQYQTFISPQYVGMDLMTNVGCTEGYAMGGRYFGGDNRGFRAPPASSPEWDTDQRYRTMQFAVVNWDNPDGYRMIVFKKVSATRLYNASKSLISTRTASSSGLEFKEASSSSTYAQVRFSTVVGNPYCTLGTIRYSVLNRMYRSGLVETVGWKNQAPSHEVYARFNDSLGNEYWKTLGQWNNTGFYCLVEPACSNVTVSKSARAS
ncbi:hypothetical protein [Intrasporangium sp. DVR]|uniref:hypothetical protein n=1 Tax=Intrasporangium sp. DVR TaxID=3127867 RepID=UPI00313A7454